MGRIMECCICSNMEEANIIIMDTNICRSCEGLLLDAKAEDLAYDLYKESVRSIAKGIIDNSVVC